ncbi:MAG: GMC family oxidoreductase [Deltaproteobacteria bacterium]|nr:GMC family oxidoreductase [Deltaproteobacteria bacterium]
MAAARDTILKHATGCSRDGSDTELRSSHRVVGPTRRSCGPLTARCVLIDARKEAPKQEIDTDLCIIGAGAAGIAIAREFAGTAVRVTLLESGGRTPDAATQSLYRGTSMAQKYFRLDAARSRYLGGSTNCWMGFCRPLDEDDFERRDWIPHSGWPYDRATLEPYYRRAQAVCALRPFGYRGVDFATPRRPELIFPDARVLTHCFQIAPTRFGELYRDELAAARNVDTWLYANVVEIEPDPGTRRVAKLRVRVLDGPEFSVRSRVVVLATGGIENARLLLASNRVEAAGLGNRHDLVGRFFMEHPHTHSGEFLPSPVARPLGLYQLHRRGRVEVLGVLALSAAVRRDARLANFTASLAPRPQAGAFERDLGVVIAGFDAEGERAQGIPRFVFSNECEQVPNPESRVQLAYERDALGMNRVTLKWRLTSEDRDSLRRSHEILAREIGRAGLGRVKPGLGGADGAWPADLNGARHHMGTTRMHSDPKQGVVDADSRVHGIANLFVAGSSVFPTSGAANPTLTIVALALRLADHLKQEFV